MVSGNEKDALHKAIDQQLEQREGRLTEAILQGDTGKLWDLITAAIENGFINHLSLNRKEAGKLRGRNVVKIKDEEPRKTKENTAEQNVVDGDNAKGRWVSRAGKHCAQANRLINIARRMQRMTSITDVDKKRTNEGYNTETLAAYRKDAARLMRPSKFITDEVGRDEERKDGGEKLMKDMTTLDLMNTVHAAKALRAAEKHKVIASMWRSKALAETRRSAKEEHAGPKKGLKKIAKQSEITLPTRLDTSCGTPKRETEERKVRSPLTPRSSMESSREHGRPFMKAMLMTWTAWSRVSWRITKRRSSTRTNTR